MQQPRRAGRGWAGLVVAAGLFLGLAACGRGPTPATPTPGPTTAPVLTATTELIAPPPATTLAPYPPLPTATLDPYPNGTARYTSTPTFTPYPTPLPADTPTPYPTAIVVPPVQTVTADTLPVLAGDVLFLAEGRLNHWHGATGQIETLLEVPDLGEADGPGAVRQFVTTAGGRLLAIERAGNSPDEFALDLFDRDTRQITRVHVSTADERGLMSLALSPNGAWLAFVTKATLAPGAVDDGTATGTVYVTRTDSPEPGVKVGPCGVVRTEESSVGCLRGGALVWSPDSTTLAWSDGLGLWIAPVGQAPRLLIASIPHNGIEPEPVDFYSPVAWSPDGEHVLALDGHYEGAGWAVIEVATGRLAATPTAWKFAYPHMRLAWVPDGRLFAVNGYFGELWRIDAASGALVLDQSFPVVTDMDGELFAAGLEQLPDGRLGWAITSDNGLDHAARGLYTFALGDQSVHKLNGLPPTALYEDVTVIWAPDGSGALVRFSYRQVIYAPTDGSALYDLTGALGEGVCCVAWLNWRPDFPRSPQTDRSDV